MTDGRRLAKRDQAPTLAAMREAGVDGPALAADLLAGQLPLGFRLADGLDSGAMNTFLIILLVAAMAATAYVLVRGVIAMASGKDVTGERSRTGCASACCSRRVAIVIVILILLLAGGGAELDRWSSSTRSTPAPATAAAPGWSTESRVSKASRAMAGDRRGRRGQ